MPVPPPELRVIVAEEFRRQLRRVGFLVFTLAVPVLMLIAIPVTPVLVDLIEDDEPVGDAMSGERTFVDVAVVDEAGLLPGDGDAGGPRRYADREAGIAAIAQGEIETLFVLPAGYVETGDVEQYRLVDEGEGIFSGNFDGEAAFRTYLTATLIAGQVDDAAFARAISPASFQSFEVGEAGTVSEAPPLAEEIGELIVPMLFAMLLLFGVMASSGFLLRSVAEEKETRMIEMLITSASPFSILSGKLLALYFAGLIQIAVWIGVAIFAVPEIFDRIPGGGELSLSSGMLTVVLPSFLLGYFLFSVLAIFIASVISSAADAQQQVGLLTMATGIPLGLVGWFINQPDNIVAEVFTYFPFTAPSMLMVRLGVDSEISDAESAAALVIVAATALLLLWVAARVFRAGILLSGQRITGRTVAAALRHSD
ncbi:MAG TPA: ABC transporter permease [Dehalococcoidia bacterium]|nr:ABC transporter permease [Dehalococcoidia bacterium]